MERKKEALTLAVGLRVAAQDGGRNEEENCEERNVHLSMQGCKEDSTR